MPERMKWVSTMSTHPSLERAIVEVATQANQAFTTLGAEPPDLAIVFISTAFASEFSRVLPLLHEQIQVPHLIGCAGGGVIGTHPQGGIHEIEDKAALSLTLARLPGAKVQSFHINTDALPDMDAPPDLWLRLLNVESGDRPHLILFADPFSGRLNDLVQGLDYACPDTTKVGGLATGGMGRGSALFWNNQIVTSGVVGVALSGDVVIEPIVAQGCRPIGPIYRVTEAERNVMISLEELTASGSRSPQPPLKVLQELVEHLSPEDRSLAQNSLSIGLAQSEFKQDLRHGDFLIRNLIGVEPRTGAIGIGDRVRVGQRVQFHLRDAQTSAEDLQLLLDQYCQQHGHGSASMGALMFACLGRGEGFYGKPDFDSALFHNHLPQVPLSGFFCNGEIGPVGGTTFLHGYTSVFGICRQLSPR